MFDLSGLPPGMIELLATHDGFMETSLEVGPIADGGGLQGVELVLASRSLARISGMLGSSVSDIAGREVWMVSLDNREGDRTRTDKGGRFQFIDLVPGKYGLWLKPKDKNQGRFGFRDGASAPESPVVELHGGDVCHVVLEGR